MAKGEKDGYPVGKKEGYAEATRNNANSTGSEAYRVGFALLGGNVCFKLLMVCKLENMMQQKNYQTL